MTEASNREQMIEKAARVVDDMCESDHTATAVGAAVLDAVLPQVTTVAELDARPWGTVLLTSYGVAFTWCADENRLRLGKHRWLPADALKDGPLTVVWQPEVSA